MTLLERSNQLQQAQKDLQYYKTAQDNIDQNYKLEKVLYTAFNGIKFMAFEGPAHHHWYGCNSIFYETRLYESIVSRLGNAEMKLNNISTVKKWKHSLCKSIKVCLK